ncbi:MAG: DEAD/DEAH box helicase family protein, partial [Deltaproteobacteria bacterium]|nr:DEAD/DEAH box helicase family protein [Deltaproteobacteria bacterium]
EAIETLIYLWEVRGIRSLSAMIAEFGGEDRETAALGVNPDDDRWPRYAFKVATGAGKTKIMSLAIVWSYFHALRENDSMMARNFVVIAPNLTVFERLKEDFGDGRIFDRDPIIPPAWLGDFNLSIVLQDATGGAATGGTLYLTNIHRLYDTAKRQARKEAETYEWMGPPVSKEKALDTGKALREQITAQEGVMILNDEAHHLWDHGSAWNEAIAFIHREIKNRTGGGLAIQLDFSATPKDNHGRIFQHVVCDTPLGEAVDGGIVKTPIIGRGQGLSERPSNDASERYEQHLLMGYQRWLKSREEWDKSGKKPLLFVMTEDTEAADQITRRLNGDPIFSELNGRVINLHTNLKGKIKWLGGKKKGYPLFVESEKEISDDDLAALRELSRDLDSGKSPYQCIVSVLMLREGWDVRNVTTIVPLRPYTSKANILPEQTLGRGLRRITPPGEAAELVTVVEHNAFVSLYQQELSQEGLPIEIVDVDKIPKSTVTIFPDRENKDLKKLEIVLPDLSGGYSRIPVLENLDISDIKKTFSRFKPLPLGKQRSEEIEYEGRHLFTNEIVERMKIRLPLLENGMGAISYYREELEHITSLKGTHQVLAPLLETFLTEILFEEKVDLFDPRLLGRLADSDVREYIRAVFVPLILSRTTIKEERQTRGEGIPVSSWKAFQATHSETHPAIPAQSTLFNLVPCNREFEVAMTQFLDHAPDVMAFCKNAGPQALRIDYLSERGRLSLYTPDFFSRTGPKEYVLIETKGREDRDVRLKAKAAIAWCEAASEGDFQWSYLYAPQKVFEILRDNRLETLIRACDPYLKQLLKETESAQLSLPFGETVSKEITEMETIIPLSELNALPSRYKKAVQQAMSLYQFLRNKEDASLAPVFTPLLGPLDEAARGLILRRLQDQVPSDRKLQREFFRPEMDELPTGEANYHKRQASNLERTLIDQNGLMPIGLLRWCLDYVQTHRRIGGVFEAVRKSFEDISKPEFFSVVDSIYQFRNEYIAHQDRELSDSNIAKDALKLWTKGLFYIWNER